MNILALVASASTEADANFIDSSEITELAKAIKMYGVIPVILAAMIIALGIFIIFTIRSNKKYTDTILQLFKDKDTNITNQNNILIEKITAIIDQKNKEVRTERNLVNIFMKLNYTLKEECHQVQEKLNCIRVGVYVCHNNTTTNTGLPFFKTSCISEWISKTHFNSGGVGAHTDLQLGIFYNLVKQTVEEGHCIIYDISEDKFTYNATVRKCMNNLGAASSIIVPIINDEDHHLGAITIEFSEPISKDTDLSDIINEGKRLAEKIAPLLDYSLYDEEVIENKNFKNNGG